MKKTEIKKLIKKQWDDLDNLIKNPNTLSTDNQKSWYQYFQSLVLNVDDDDVTKENLVDLLKNLKLWGIDAILYNK